MVIKAPDQEAVCQTMKIGARPIKRVYCEETLLGHAAILGIRQCLNLNSASFAEGLKRIGVMLARSRE